MVQLFFMAAIFLAVVTTPSWMFAGGSDVPVDPSNVIDGTYHPFYTQLKCLPGYVDPILKVFTDAQSKCSNGVGNSSRTCHSFCLGTELGMITPRGLNKNELKRLLTEQLPGEGGKDSVNNLMKMLGNCQILLEELKKDCNRQLRLWPCVDKAFHSCP